ncbi:hypothetical protein EWE75_22550 [Sphingomonas populi]|uniref:Uncharacterized protein n=1 Tax=Sphingomonas populi TaxID=2484750 RepID=A0A4Q6XV53_9SPHN|nr:hypothetical protein [Sphingomonas populi]RZF60537.1 hypothetical protein EWE75_22550 [Sphingomonas populi]
MRLTLMAATGASLLIALAMGGIWFLRSSPVDVIPAEFRGVWHDLGAECDDTDAQASITGSSINYDVLVFKAAGISPMRDHAVTVSGTSFPNGRADYEKVTLRLTGPLTELYINAPDLPSKRPLVRCYGPS